LPGKHSTVFPLRRYSFIGAAATLLIVLVSWVAVRAVGPTQPDAHVPLMIQPTVPLAADGPSPVPEAGLSGTPSLSPSASRSAAPRITVAATSSVPKRTRPTTKPAPRRTTSPPPPAAAFTARYTSGGSWNRGFIGTLAVTNKTGPARDWTVRLRFDPDAGVRLGNVWNARATRDGDTFVLTGGPLAPGATASLGFEASKQVRDRIQPSGCTVDGAPCDLG